MEFTSNIHSSFKNLQGAGICYKNFSLYVDHVLPLCDLLQTPLFFTDFSLYYQAKCHYPYHLLHYIEPENYLLDEILSPYHFLIYAELYRKHHGSFEFGEHLLEKPVRSICAPHGNSEKGMHSFWMERYVDEDIVLIYGDKMQRFFFEKGVKLERVIRTGNYRLNYYLKHKTFFDEKVKDELQKRAPSCCTLFYAPTWQINNPSLQDPLDKTSFFEASRWIFEVPEEFCLIVKLHPNLYRFYPEEILEIKKQVGFHPRVIFLEDSSLIYPYLSHADAYIGDFSSVGYDFLSFDRPLYFINFNRRALNDPGLTLYKTGRHFLPEEFPRFYHDIASHFGSDQREFSNVRQQLYHDVFDEEALPLLKESILGMI